MIDPYAILDSLPDNNTLQIKFTHRMIEKRKLMGINQRELSKLTGIDQAYITFTRNCI